MSKLELLAPAGNFLKMQTAFACGAEAVYLGLPDFSLRVRINDFDLKKIKKAVLYAHERQKKVYITLNILAHNKQLAKIPAHIKALRQMGVDALIVSDPGIIALVKKYWPKAEIHLSTQANCTNKEAAKFWAKQGIKRIILGREVTLSEIKEIKKAVPKIDLEYFIHGAMCMAYSGRCFLSKELTGRSGNLGDCAQPCRFEYSLKARNYEQEFDIVPEEHGSYLLNSKDLCLIEYLPQLIEAGITSFKIEGRAKSVYYQACVSGIYARALDFLKKNKNKEEIKRELGYLKAELIDKLVHRGYTTGFLLGGKGEQNITSANHLSAWEFCGQVLLPQKKWFQPKLANHGKPLYFLVHNTVKLGDSLEIITPKYGIIKLTLKKMIDVGTGEELSEAHGGGGAKTVAICLKEEVPEFSVLRRKK